MPDDLDGRWMGPTPFNIPNTTISDGQGHTMPDARGLFVLHAALLHTGKVICFAGHVERIMYAPVCYLFDPASPTASMSPISFPSGTDLFCCHYVQIPDGKLLAVGGSQHDSHHPVTGAVVYRGSTGTKTIALFDPSSERWSMARKGGSVNELKQGRWYPTPVVLPDGRVAVFSGRRELTEAGNWPSGVSAPGIASMVEILKASDDWASTELTYSGAAFPDLPIYPGMHLAKDGRIYFVHTNWGQQIPDLETLSLEIANNANTGSWTDHGTPPGPRRREEGMSVLLPPAQDGKILVIGGSKACKGAASSTVGVFEGATGPYGPSAFTHIQDPLDPTRADIFDTATRAWTSVGPLNFGRINGHCVILPDATVLICGGHDNYKWQDTARTDYPPPVAATNPSNVAEIFDPAAPAATRLRTVPVAERGAPGRAMGDPRMYHSVALLLPDGSVFTAGGADPNREEPPPDGGPWVSPVEANFASGWVASRRYGPGNALNVKTFEIYRPPYFFKGARPTVAPDGIRRDGTAISTLEYGQAFEIVTPQANDIADVALMRPGAPTHHTDTEQRFVRLSFTKASGQLNVAAFNDPKLAPPGYYMVWIVDSQKRPCQVARWVKLESRRSTCVVATAAYGSADHPEVARLRALREELRTTTAAGRWFMDRVTRVYDAVSPPLAARMTKDPGLRDAVRDAAVRPVVGTIAASERLARRLPSRVHQHAVMLGLFGLEAIAGVLLAPAVAAAVLLRLGRDRERRG